MQENKIFKIGIIGSENSHADLFAGTFMNKSVYPDMEVVAVFGTDEKANKTLCERYGISYVAKKPEDMVGMVDAVLITARDGKFHLEYAKPFLEAGIPMFVDKPFTTDIDEAVYLAKEAKKRGIPLMGGSSIKRCFNVMEMARRRQEMKEAVRGGFAVAPVQMESPYSGFWFYSSHLVEMCLTIFGFYPESVTAIRRGGSVTAILHYESFDVSAMFLEGVYKYCAQISCPDSEHANGETILFYREIETAWSPKHEASEFANMLRCGVMGNTYEELVMPVCVMSAIKQSYETGKTVSIKKITL